MTDDLYKYTDSAGDTVIISEYEEVLTVVKFDDKWYSTSTGEQYSEEDVRDIFFDPVCSAKVVSTVDFDKD